MRDPDFHYNYLLAFDVKSKAKAIYNGLKKIYVSEKPEGMDEFIKVFGGVIARHKQRAAEK